MNKIKTPLLFLILLFICATDFCVFVSSAEETKTPNWQKEPQIERGKPNLIIDGIGNILSIPQKIVLLNPRIDNHAMSEKTLAVMKDFLAQNKQIKDTKIRINQFAPIGEFKRLTTNRKIKWWWRVFPGIPITALSLTGRIFGGDNYNPYTDTINIYSNLAPVALHEMGHAVDTAEKVEEGWADYYTVGRILTPVTLNQEYTATEKAIQYLDKKNDPKEENEAYGVLYPAYGTYLGSYSGIPYGNVVGAAVGHVASILPRHDNNLSHKAYQSAVTSHKDGPDLKSDPLAKILIEDHEKTEKNLNRVLLREERFSNYLIDKRL